MRHCLALDLKNDADLIREYEDWHKRVWPEIVKSIKDSGITSMEIYRVANRLFMIIEADETFTFEKKATLDSSNPKVQEWEQLMWKYQQSIPGGEPGVKWRRMERIFEMG